MPRAAASNDRPALLVEGLKRVIARDGWDGATVAAIAAEAGLAPGLVHYYFPRKLDLVLALLERLKEGLAARLGRRRGRAVDALIEACLAPGDDEDREAVRCFVAVGAQALRDAEIAAAWRSVVETLRAAFADALAAEGTEDPAAAAGLVAAVLGGWQLGAVHPELAPPGWAAPTVAAMARGLSLRGLVT